MIIPVILEKNLEEVLAKINTAKNFADTIQLDITDSDSAIFGSFNDLNKLENQDDLELEVHLMVREPMTYMDRKYNNVKKICSQVENQPNINDFLIKAREFGYKRGVSVALDTPIDDVVQYIDKIDFIQFMSVKIGLQGQVFSDDVYSKIRTFKQMYPNIFIQVDGGINETNIRKLKSVGVEGFVIGSAIFNDRNPKLKYVELSNLI